MPTCTEIAVFEVKKANLARVLAVSEVLFSEINAEQKNIIAHQILTKTDLSNTDLPNSEKPNTELFKEKAEEVEVENTKEQISEVCWHLTWANAAAVQASKLKWSTYPSAAEIESLVGSKLYYGHFVAAVGN